MWVGPQQSKDFIEVGCQSDLALSRQCLVEIVLEPKHCSERLLTVVLSVLKL